MKHSYRHFASTISTIALCSVFSAAQPSSSSNTSDTQQVPSKTESAVESNTNEVVQPTEAAPQIMLAQPAEASPQAEVELFDGTELKGEISGFLKADKSPYLVTEDITVAPNTVLIIEPGTTLLFKPNTGIIAKGQFVATGTKAKPVTFSSAVMVPKAGDWKGIFITGEESAEISNAVILSAKTAIVIENGGILLQNTKVNSSSERGLYARNASVKISNCEFIQNKGVAVHLSNYSDATIERSNFSNNNVAILNSELANTNLSASHLTSNEHALVSMDNSILNLRNNKIENNKVGYASSTILDKRSISNITGNKENITNKTQAVVASVPANPEIPGVKQRPVVASDKIGVLARQKEKAKLDSSATTWKLSGTTMVGANYHHVITSKNNNEDEVVAGELIEHGEHYTNVFQVPGVQGIASANLTLQSNKGQTLEFSMDLTSDTWNHFSPNPVSIRYTDNIFNAVLGDFYKVGSEIYMSGIPVFGVDVTASILKNTANDPLIELNGFFGEAQRPTIPGKRNPLIYKNYIEDGSATAQRLAYGGSFKLTPVHSFDATLGFIYANDEIDEPFLRDGKKGAMTSDPMISALTVYSDVNKVFFPGNLELKGQFAVGRADTADVVRERAINEVFNEANLEVASFSTLRSLMQNENLINQLSQEELQEIFGENTPLSKAEMADSLKVLIKKAKTTKKNADSDRDDGRVMGLNWGSQNFALGLSLDWNYYKTSISTHVKYVGSEFFSAGSPDQLSNTREFLFKLDQNIKDIWDLELAYQFNVENAATGKKTNIFGFSEDSRWGLSSDDNEEWFNEHEKDNDRAKYIHDMKFGNTFRINPKFSINAGYNLNYHQQYRPTQLHGSYALEDGIYGDSWFKARQGKATITIENNGKEVEVDSARWTEYASLANQPFLASRFQECIFKNTWDLGFTFRAAKSVFKAAGRWTLRTDASKFHKKDELISKMDLSNSTWGKLGYYFHGADYFEHTYPISVTTTLTDIQNRFAVTPRFKSYERDDMKESEVTFADDFEIPFKEKFFILGIGVQFRYMFTTWDENDESQDSKEMDFETGANLRVNHTKNLFSEWNFGFTYYSRPDNLSNEYKDIFGGVRLNYVF